MEYHHITELITPWNSPTFGTIAHKNGGPPSLQLELFKCKLCRGNCAIVLQGLCSQQGISMGGTN